MNRMQVLPEHRHNRALRILFSGLLIISMAVSLTACGSRGGGPSREAYQGSSNQTTETQSGEVVFGLNETAVFEKLKITATGVYASQGSDFLHPDEGKVFLGVVFDVENISNEDQSISSILLFDPYINDTKAEYSFIATSALKESLDVGQLDGTIASGKRIVGVYGMEVSPGQKTLQFEVRDTWLGGQKASFVINTTE